MSSQKHFKRDIIMPNIYALENIKLIQNHQYEHSPINKVHQLKKKILHQKVNLILNKPNPIPIDLQKGQSLQHHRVRPQTAPKRLLSIHPHHLQIVNAEENDHLFMDFDQDIGEKIKIMNQNHEPFSEKMKSLFSRVKSIGQLKKQNQSQNFRNSSIGDNDRRQQKVKTQNGLNKEKRKQQKGDLIKNRSKNVNSYVRPKTAMSKPREATPYNPSCLSSFTISSDILLNIKRKSLNQPEKAKASNLLSLINTCIQSNNYQKKELQTKIHSMNREWKKSQAMFANMNKRQINGFQINYHALDALQEKRLHKKAIKAQDSKIFE